MSLFWKARDPRNKVVWVQRENVGEWFFDVEAWVMRVLFTYVRTFVPYGNEMVHWLDKIYQGFSVKDVLSYFSVWNLIFLTGLWLWCARARPSRTSSPSTMTRVCIRAVETSLVLCSVGGFYLAWIYPRHVFIGYLSLYVHGILMKTIDLMAHQLPLYLYFEHVQPTYRLTDAVVGSNNDILWVAGDWVPALLYALWQRSSILVLYGIRWIDLFIIVLCSSLMTRVFRKKK